MPSYADDAGPRRAGRVVDFISAVLLIGWLAAVGLCLYEIATPF
jgi:hypothetical protein